MAYPTLTLVHALRQAAHQLKNGAMYAWGNHGSCNCGHLLQVITDLSSKEILQYAQSGIGEWTELAEDYCGVTNAPVDLLLTKLQEAGLTPTDIHNLEYLEDREVLNKLPGGFRWLKKNVREDVIVYFETFALVLEEKYHVLKERRALRNIDKTTEVEMFARQTCGLYNQKIPLKHYVHQ